MEAEAKNPSLDPVMRVKALIALTEELSAILERENGALRARRPGELAPLQAEKARLAAAYAEAIRDVASDRAAIGAAGEALLSSLKEITREFEGRAGEQRALLAAAMETGEGVMRAIAAEAGATAKPAYGPSLKAASAPNVQLTLGPLSVNENA